MKIIDISLGIEENMIFYPGDPEFTLNSVLDMSKGDDLNLSEVKMGVHTGSHIDSPLHFIKNGESISDLPLTRFYGSCLVIDRTDLSFGTEISRESLDSYNIGENLIILFKTKNSSILNNNFREDFVSLSLEAAKLLTKLKIQALGIDYLSIGSPDTHKYLLSNGIIVYEGLRLSSVDPGMYTFIGFPLKLMGSEGAPTRAVLIKE
ncbi:MAG: cyclase family protein [Candidatus Heimdallarchaeota archaeon]|nr:MAG: cyclase family protein [Candidatus Heimdallarchaeota archaeon]